MPKTLDRVLRKITAASWRSNQQDDVGFEIRSLSSASGQVQDSTPCAEHSVEAAENSGASFTGGMGLPATRPVMPLLQRLASRG